NFAYVYFSDPDGARGIAFFGMAEMGIELSPAYILFSLGILFAVESAVTAGLFFTKIWARTFTIWWGILSLVMVALSFKNLTVWLLPQVLYIVAATALLFAKKDFAEK
ncbi:MAG: hypothetical protein LBG79_03615, partial [Spirochaetaceae bacterium]|nr:hypothetical protein [Spirochaetaceae bacterium]